MRSCAPQSLHRAAQDHASSKKHRFRLMAASVSEALHLRYPTIPGIKIDDLSGHTEQTEMSQSVAACCRSQSRTVLQQSIASMGARRINRRRPVSMLSEVMRALFIVLLFALSIRDQIKAIRGKEKAD